MEMCELQSLLDLLRAELTEESWRLFELRFIEEHGIEHIAAVTDLKSDAIYARISRIRKTARRLRHELLLERAA